jgi:Protein tyrosine and serine/threonine kinase
MITMTTSTSQSLINLGFTVLTQSKVALHSDPNQGGKYDILRLLAVTRDLNISILPHQWENWLGAIGQGGSAIVNQAFANVKTSFAFKCFQDTSEENGYKEAIQEMSVLGLPLLLDQPNIVQLQGVSFEATRDENVRPMLIYEKSKHGDLFTFARSPAGKELGLPERMAICKDIGSAILFMHSCSKCLDKKISRTM